MMAVVFNKSPLTPLFQRGGQNIVPTLCAHRYTKVFCVLGVQTALAVLKRQDI